MAKTNDKAIMQEIEGGSIAIHDGILELMVKLGVGRPSSSGKSTLLYSGTIKLDDGVTFVGLNVYRKQQYQT